MNTRQCLGLGLLGGVVVLSGFTFLRRNEPLIQKFMTEKPFTLITCLILVTIILGIIFSTPITSHQLTDAFYILLIVVGVLQSSLGGIGYLVFPETVAQHMNVSSHVFFQRDIGITYIAIGIMSIIAGATREQPLSIVFFFTLFCWGRVYLMLSSLSNKYDTEKLEPSCDNNTNDKTTKYYTLETYVNTVVPFVLGSIYLTAVTQ